MKLSENKNVLTETYHLTAGQTDIFGLMPLSLVTFRVIELATEHANLLGIGYSDLATHGMAWVLARLSIQMIRYPKINEFYTLSTWIESYNRFFSDRCFLMTDGEGCPVAHIRSVWVAIDVNKRAMADLTAVEQTLFPIAQRECPVPKCTSPRIARDVEKYVEEYSFKYSDLDFNGHVNTLRYIDLVMNQHSPDWYRANQVKNLDASFEHECYYGQTAEVVTGQGARNPEATVTEVRTDGRTAVSIGLS